MADRRFVGYCRVSTAKQGASGLGLEAQRAAIAAYVSGGELLAGYEDIESGTRKGNARPALTAAIAHAKREKAVLVIAKLDRLARNVAFVSQLMESGVEFVATDMPVANKLSIHILAAVAEAEAEAIGARTKAALAAAKARGTKLGTPKNLTHEAQLKGAAARREKAIADYAKTAHVAAILRQRAWGNSFASIARELNAAGHRTTTGKPFLPTTVSRLLERLN